MACFSWQDLKDFIRQETKIETSFCQAHRDKVGEGLGKGLLLVLYCNIYVVAFNRMQDREDVIEACDGLMINGKKVLEEQYS